MTPGIPAHVATLSSDLQLAATAAFDAGEIIRNGYDQLHEVKLKGIGDLVSEVDQNADRAALAILSDDPRQLPILSEELSPDLTTSSDNLWIVDPLDGTSAFLFKTGPHFSSVLIAQRREGETQLGIVYFPITGEWFYAEKGRGAFKNGERLLIGNAGDLQNGWVELNQYSDVQYESDFFVTVRNQLRTAKGAGLVTQNAPYSGVAMRIAESENLLVAAIHDNDAANVKQAAWDIAAPQCVLEEAGGVFLNADGERVNPFVAQPFVVARSKKIADEVLGLIREA